MAALSRARFGLAMRKWLTLAAAAAILLSGCGGRKQASVPLPAPDSTSPAEPSVPPESAAPAPAPESPAAPAQAAPAPASPPIAATDTPEYSDYKRPKQRAKPPQAADVHPPPPPPVAARPAAPMPAFQWPPPQASEEYVLPRSVFGDESMAKNFSDVDRVLVAALDVGGYSARNYYSVPNGFALATRIEQINGDGSPKMPPARFALEPEPVSMLRPLDYLRALLKGVPGYYRVIVFIVTDTPFQASGERPTEAQATAWISSGVNVLPREIGDLPFTRDVNCTALVYEFLRKPGADSDATEFATPGRLDAMTHLVKSGIWRGLHTP